MLLLTLRRRGTIRNTEMSGGQDDHRRAEAGAAAVRLAKETGITEAEATDLVAILGMNWSSLVREARLLKPRR
jgi:hypothetical protein